MEIDIPPGSPRIIGNSDFKKDEVPKKSVPEDMGDESVRKPRICYTGELLRDLRLTKLSQVKLKVREDLIGYFVNLFKDDSLNKIEPPKAPRKPRVKVNTSDSTKPKVHTSDSTKPKVHTSDSTIPKVGRNDPVPMPLVQPAQLHKSDNPWRPSFLRNQKPHLHVGATMDESIASGLSSGNTAASGQRRPPNKKATRKELGVGSDSDNWRN